jgi:hypothetical protein
MKLPTLVCFSHDLVAGFLLLDVAQAATEVPAAPPGSPVNAEAKPYVLYMRTDVAVELDKKLYPIKDVSGRDFIISVGGQKEAVPMGGGQHRIEFKYLLTLAPATASLTGLKTERTYTPGTDPRMVRQREAAMTNAVLGDNRALAEANFIKNFQGGFFGYPERAGSLVSRGNVGGPGGAGQTSASVGMAMGQASAGNAAPDPSMDDKATAAFSSMTQSEAMMSSDLGQVGGSRGRAESDLAKQLFDAVAISFEVSSKVFLEKPYLVVTTRFHEKDAKPGEVCSGVFAKALDSIGTHPTRIEVLHGGFPPGFELDELQVHLYNEGKEVPTDVAQKRVPLTREEAFEYLKIDYFRGHKGETMPATPAVGRPERLELARLMPKQREAAYFVQVDKTGHPVGGVYIDEECSQPAEEAVAVLAAPVRYYPALNQGKAVDGVARLIFTHLDL